MGKRGKIFMQLWTVVHWQASTLGNREAAKDDVRKENELLCSEIDNLQRELKKLKQIVEQLAREYEESKAFDPLRRYERLKGMIKRTVMHLRLNPDEPNSVQGLGIGELVQGCRDYNYQMESARRREDKYPTMSRQELAQENIQLQEQAREMRQKCSVVHDLVDGLQKRYDSSKRYAVLQRYSMLKTMIKSVISDKLVTH